MREGRKSWEEERGGREGRKRERRKSDKGIVAGEEGERNSKFVSSKQLELLLFCSVNQYSANSPLLLPIQYYSKVLFG